MRKFSAGLLSPLSLFMSIFVLVRPTCHVVMYLWLCRFMSETLKPIVQTEFQLLYVYHLVGPFLQRFHQERTRCMLEVQAHI